MPVARVKRGPIREMRQDMCITEYNEAETMQMFKEEGRQEGRQEGRKDMILSMLRKGKTPQDIADFCDADLSEIESIQEEMLVAK